MIRDLELARLIKYSEGMGLKVSFKPYIRGTHRAEWALDGTEIIIYVTNRCSKLEKVLSLIHELGHQKAFIDNERNVGEKVDEALNEEDPKKFIVNVFITWNLMIHSIGSRSTRTQIANLD
jgi:hypothetical protein